MNKYGAILLIYIYIYQAGVIHAQPRVFGIYQPLLIESVIYVSTIP